MAVARTAALVASGLAALAANARARVPCAAGGPPLYADEQGYAAARAIEPTATLTLLATPWARGTSRLAGAPTDGPGFDLGHARLGVCGGTDGLSYRLVWEPFALDERAHLDAHTWGRIVDASIAWLPAEWAAIAAGVGKVPLTRGREQPEGAMPLATLPLSTAALAPDRRLGLTGDADLGVARLALGVYTGSRLSDLDAPGGILVAARLVLEPVGPVGRRAWPEWDPPTKGTDRPSSWNARVRGAFGLSAAYRRDSDSSGYLAGADFALHGGRLALDGELLYADKWPLERPTATPGQLGRRLGGYLEALVVAWSPWLAFAARAEYLDEDLLHPGPGRLLAFAGGANVYALGPSIQLQALYQRTIPLAGGIGSDALLFALTVGR